MNSLYTEKQDRKKIYPIPDLLADIEDALEHAEKENWTMMIFGVMEQEMQVFGKNENQVMHS